MERTETQRYTHQSSPLRRRLLASLLVVTFFALTVSCIVTVVELRRISQQTLEITDSSNDEILTDVSNAFYQSALSLRLSAAWLGSKTLTKPAENPTALLDEALLRMQDVDMLLDDVVFLAQDGKLLTAHAVFPENIGVYDTVQAQALLTQTIDLSPAAYGIELADGEIYTDILDYSAQTGGFAGYSTDDGMMLVILPGENGMQLGILTPDVPASYEVQVLRETAEQYQLEAQASIAKTRRELVATLAVIWLVMAAAILLAARKMTAALATPVEREQLEREYALQKSEDEKRALAEIDRLKTEFLGNISHELKTPLTVMSGYAKDSSALLRGKAAEDELDAVKHNMRIITAEADRLALMVSQLLDQTSIDEGRIALHMEKVAPVQLISDTLGTYYPMFAGHGNTVTFKREDSIPEISCDSARIRQVLINLLSNATRHTKGGKITVTLSREAGCAVFSVADDGDGISAEALPHVFERYDRDSKKTDGGRNTGTGLGLYISKYFVEAHGGQISAESRIGVGTTIRFTIPLHSAPSGTDTSSPASS